jgi:hypothetical protein
MYPPRWFLPYDIIIQLVMTLVSMGIAIYALRGFRWVKERSLYYLYLAFVLLAIGFFASGVTYGIDFLGKLSGPGAPPSVPILDLGTLAYYLFSIAAYAILAYAYFRNVRDASIAIAAFGSVFMAAAPVLETVVIVLLFMIVFAQLIHLSVRRSRSALAVCGSFGLILVSNILVLTSSVESEDFYVAGKVLELVAFVILLLLLLRMRGPR